MVWVAMGMAVLSEFVFRAPPGTSSRILREAFGELIARKVESPTLACFDCGAIVPVGDSFTSTADPAVLLCEPCFRHREAGGRAKERPSA